jgi:hypothetical protein
MTSRVSNPVAFERENPPVVPSGQLVKLNPDELVPSQNNPRHLFDREPLNTLKKSIRQHGVLVPITVYRPRGQKKFSILDGQRRYICCRELQQEEGIDLYAVQYFVGNFSEFLLAPCVCEEAFYKLGERGIEAIAGMIHSTSERPLHAYNSSLAQRKKERLLEICTGIDKAGGLGYKDLATMVVFYRNAPNTLPVIFRGNVKQSPFIGVLPRTTDLPPNVDGN